MGPKSRLRIIAVTSSHSSIQLHCAHSCHSTGISPHTLVGLMSVLLCIKKCQDNVAFACKEASNFKLPSRCVRWLTSTLPTKFSFSCKILLLLSMGGCCEFFARTCLMATILCAPPCPARTTMTSPARGKGGQWPGCPGTSKFLRGLGSSNSYATRNRCPSPNGFKGIGIKKYINCLTGLVLNSMGFKFSKHILFISCKRGIREFSRGSHWSKYRARKKTSKIPSHSCTKKSLVLTLHVHS